MIRFILVVALSFFIVNLANAASPKPAATKQTGTTSRPTTAPRSGKSIYKVPTKAKKKVDRLKLDMVMTRSNRNLLSRDVKRARKSENRLKRRLKKQLDNAENPGKTKSELRAATVKRANLELQLSDAKSKYLETRSQYKKAHKALTSERVSLWRTLVSKISNFKKGTPKTKARKIQFAKSPLGPSKSNGSKPPVTRKGILKWDPRVSTELARLRRDESGKIINPQ